MTVSQVAIAISCFSTLIALFALGWNIYRDIVLKPKVKVTLQVSEILTQGVHEEKRPTKIMLKATNFGPGHVVLNGISGFNKHFLRKRKWFVMLHDYTDPYSRRFPCKLEIGEECIFFFKFKEDSFLKENVQNIAIYDSFGRHHWVPKKDIELSKKFYQKTFNQSKT